MNKSLKEIQEDTNNQCKEINKTVQYLKLEIKSVKKKKKKTEGILETITITNNNGISYSLTKKFRVNDWTRLKKKKVTMETDNKLQIKIAKDKNQWN